MFSMYKYIIIGGVVLAGVVGLYLYVQGLKDDIKTCKYEISQLRADIAISDLEKAQLKQSVTRQNQAIRTLKNSNELKLKELKKWKSQNPQVKYKTITKIREVQSDECKDIKSQLDDIKRIDINRV